MALIRTLLADDHAIVRAGIRKTIEEIPELEIVGEVGSGPQVFQVLQRETVDFLLIDITMPDFDPISAIRSMRSAYPAMRILVISAYDDDIYVQGLLSAGVNGYHLKDQPLNDLKLAVERVLSGDRWISSPLIGKLLRPNQHIPSLPQLTNRQRDLLRLLQSGMDNQSIAQEMGLSVKTVENNLTRLYRQLDVQSRLEAVNIVQRFPQILGASGKDAAQAEPSANLSNTNLLNILVVDDNVRYRKQLQRMIGKVCQQATIHEAGGIKDALDLILSVEPVFVLVDVVLGDEDGISLTRRIKALRPHTRIILISAYPDREFHRQGIQAGAVAFLDKKDLDLATLRQLIDDITP